MTVKSPLLTDAPSALASSEAAAAVATLQQLWANKRITKEVYTALTKARVTILELRLTGENVNALGSEVERINGEITGKIRRLAKF